MVSTFDFDKVLDYKTVNGIMEDLYFFARRSCPAFMLEFFKKKFSADQRNQTTSLIALKCELRS